jgi:Fur family ferric uptake transcriptional regulator
MKTSDSVIDYIQAKGERLTVPRRLVIEALGQSHEHLTIGNIQQHIQEDHHDHLLSDTTVYRVLQWLKELGLVSQTDMGQTGTVYALMSNPHHHHLICLTCGATITLEDELFTPLRGQLLRDYGFEARIDHMAIYGQCRNCLNRKSKPE